MKARWVGVGLATGLVSLATMNYMFMGGHMTAKAMAPGIGNVDTLLVKYDAWKYGYQRSVSDQNLVIGMGSVMGLSKEYSEASGQMEIDLNDGQVAVRIQKLPEAYDDDVFLVDTSAKVNEVLEKQTLRLGSLVQAQDAWELNATLNQHDLFGFEIDQVVVTKANTKLQEGVMVVGSPSLFQKLYYNELRQPCLGQFGIP